MNYNRRNILKGSASMLAIFGISNFAMAGGKVNFYNWTDYIGENNLSSFRKKTGISVSESYFGSGSEAFSKLKSKKSGYDVAVPASYTVLRMSRAGMLEKIDWSKIPNFKNINPVWKNLSFDPKNEYSVPYLWGTTGVGYNSKATGDTDMSDMKWVMESSKFSGQIAWLDSPNTMVNVAMIYLNGDLPAEHDPKLMAEAFKLMSKQKKHIKVFANDTGQDLLMSGDVNIAVEYSGDIGQIGLEDSAMKYALPTNGGTRWVDVLVIPKNAPNLDNAHKFINHMLDAQQGKELAEYTTYATPNKAAYDIASSEYKNDPARFPDDEIIAKLPFSKYYGEQFESDLSKHWTKLKTL